MPQMEKDAATELQRAQNGDETALASIIARQMPLIRALAARSVTPGLEFEDAVQEGLIALFFALNSFDESRGVSFSTYASVCIQNGVTDAARKAGRRKHAPLNSSVPLDAAGSVPTAESQSPAQAAEARELYSATMQELSNRLSPLEKQVLALFLDGLAYSAIAKRLSITDKAVDNALQRVRAKLR